jgi:uncharacterized protein (DUF1499 family)
MRGRRYAIPFQRVWTEAVEVVIAGAPRWRLLDADDERGVIRAEARTLLFRFVDDVEILVRLDADAQTRVDLSSRSRRGMFDLGVNGRRIRRFLHQLDRAVGATPELVLPPEEGVAASLGA